MLIVDATENTASKGTIANMPMCKVIHAKAVECFADACNLAASKATGKYITVCNCGDTFSDNYFESCIKVFDKMKNSFCCRSQILRKPCFQREKGI